MKIRNKTPKAHHKKLTYTISPGERGQWEEEKNSTGKNSHRHAHVSIHYTQPSSAIHEKPKLERCEMEERARKKAQKANERWLCSVAWFIQKTQLNVNGNTNNNNDWGIAKKRHGVLLVFHISRAHTIEILVFWICSTLKHAKRARAVLHIWNGWCSIKN